MSADCAIIVHTCDRYQLLFKGFEYFFRKNWPLTEGINRYFLTEVVDFHSDIFINIKTGEGAWSERLRRGLQQIHEPYIIYIQEDMWLTQPVQAEILKDLVAYARNENMALMKWHGFPEYRPKPTGKTIGGLQVTVLDNKRSKYILSHQVSLWNSEFLLSQLKEDEDPWNHEIKGTRRLRKSHIPIFQTDLFAENGKAPINHNPSNSARSAYITVSWNGLLNESALPLIDELNASGEEELKLYAAELKHHLTRKLTHDGLERPRKFSRYDRLKSWVLRNNPAKVFRIK